MKRIYFYLLLILFVPYITLAQSYFTGIFTPHQEPHEVSLNANGSGTASCILTDDGLWFFITVTGLTGQITGAHFHRAEIGEPGPPVRDILPDFTGTSARGIWTRNDAQPLTDSFIKDLLLGKIYLNVHTPQNPEGELRAQVILSSGVGFMAMLSPEQEPHEVNSQAVGTGVFTLTDEGLKFETVFENLTTDLTAAHFHRAPFGVNGPPVRTILTEEIQNKMAKGVWAYKDAVEPLTDQFVRDLLTGNIYINFHTTSYPNGELRGQLLINGGWNFVAQMDTSQLNTPITAGTSGLGIYTLTNAGLVYNSTVDALTGTVNTAGFYRGGMNQVGDLLRNYTNDMINGNVSGYWSFRGDEALNYTMLQDLFRDNIYTNISTLANPTGETRGQLMYMPGTNFSLLFSGPQAGSDVITQGSGIGYFNVSDTALDYNMQFSGLSGNITGANVYTGMNGMQGDSILDIYSAFDGNIAQGSWMKDSNPIIMEGIMRNLMTGNMYIGINTQAYANNELRSQFNVATGTGLKAVLTAKQEVDEVDNADNARGVATFILTDAGLAYHMTLANLTGPVTSIQIMRGGIGEKGTLVKPITADIVNDNAVIGFWSINDNDALTQEYMNDLLAGNMYINVLTSENTNGEIRGQIFINGGFGFTSRLTGSEVVPAVNSDAVGTGAFTLTPAGLVYNITLEGFNEAIAGATINNAPMGQNGPVNSTITSNIKNYTAFGVWRSSDDEPFTTDMFGNLFGRNLYVTVGSQTNPTGEIRGQIITGDMLTSVNESPVDNQLADLDQNYPNPFSGTTTINYSLTELANVDITITNSLGMEVIKLLSNAQQEAGPHSIEFNADNLATGVYYCTLQAGSTSRTIKLTVIK